MGTCASRLDENGVHSGALDGASLAAPPTHSFKQLLLETKSLRLSQQPQQQQQDEQQQPDQGAAPPFPIEQLPDEVLSRVLSELPFAALVQLGSCSRRLHSLVSNCDKVLQSVDLSTVPKPKLDAALGWLLARPHVATLQSLTAPLNHVCAPKLLAAATPELAHLTLYVSPKAQGPEPELKDLHLEGLTRLLSLALPIAHGALRKGQHLALPATLQELTLTAGGFASAAAALDGPHLPHLHTLSLHVMDASNAKPLTSLAALRSLVDLRVGRFWSVPSELHAFLRLESLAVECYAHVTNGMLGDVQQPLSAHANGLQNLPTRPTLHLSLDISVLAPCGGLTPDWHTLSNLCELRLDNIYPEGHVFRVGALAELPRLQRLHLGFADQLELCSASAAVPQGFESVNALPGMPRALRITGLPELGQLQELAMCSKGPELDLSFQAPPHVRTLLVLVDGGVTLEMTSSGSISRSGSSDTGAHRAATAPAAASPNAAWPEALSPAQSLSPPASPSTSFDGLLGPPQFKTLCSITETDVVVEPVDPDPCHQLGRIHMLGIMSCRPLHIIDATVPQHLRPKKWGFHLPGRDQGSGAFTLQQWLPAKGMTMEELHLHLRQLHMHGQSRWLLVRSGCEHSVLAALQELC